MKVVIQEYNKAKQKWVRKWQSLFDQTPIWSKISSSLYIDRYIFIVFSYVKIESVVVGCFDFLKAFLDSLILLIINETSKLVRRFFFEVSHKFSFWSKFFKPIFWLGFSILKNFVASCNFCLSGISQNIDLLDL